MVLLPSDDRSGEYSKQNVLRSFSLGCHCVPGARPVAFWEERKVMLITHNKIYSALKKNSRKVWSSHPTF